MVRWLIDGYNVIRSDPELRARERTSLEAGRRALIHLVAGLARRSRDEFTVVFDGAIERHGLPTAGRVSIVFSRAPEKADDVLIRLAERVRDGAVVVTSDRTIAHAARRAHASVVDSPTFAERARAAAAPAAANAGATGLAPAADHPSALDAAAAEKGDDADEAPARKSGNPRRASKKARATTRALRRLRPS